ncbi:putative Flp pilus assembly protein TadG [uncultured Eubacteriales bacterium]|uniref:Putative Flp pilus assembly protein TadG n=1 Tax=uncultured Eubacteriales bacterium TaxID=172733 RepID=A0A212JE65_9FIRM|nr:putative Flp pilus assembly protein TadG [uncultured Eubacteriales bacterium]
MKSLWKRLCALGRHEGGQGIVELALTLPLVLALLCGMLELGWICANKLQLDNICRESTRYGITYAASNAENQAMVKNRAVALATDNLKTGLTIDVTYSDASDYRAGDLTVTLSYNLPTLTPLLGIFSGNSIPLKSTCSMKMG